jgi:hypothetical protein
VKSLQLICAFFFALFLSVPEDSGIESTLTKIAQESAIKVLTGKEFPIEIEGFAGTIVAINPKKNFKAKVEKFSLAGDTVSATFKAKGLVRIKGKYSKDDATVDLDATLAVDLVPTVEGKIYKRGDEFFIQPSVKDMDFKIEIKEFSPDSLPGGKASITKLLNAAYVAQKATVLKAINASVVERKLEL